jgi:hypothetical protein
MIPEHYWRILKSWFWLIGGFGIALALAAALALPSLLSTSEKGYSSAVTLGVTRMVSFGGTTAAGSGDPELLASYTENIAERGSSPQYLSNLESALREKRVTLPDGELERSLRFTANRGLYRVTIEATANVPNDAEIIAETAADQLISDTAAEETRIVTSLNASSEQQETQLLTRLNEVYQDRIARLNTLGEPALRQSLDELVRRGVGADLTETYATLVQDLARISGDPELAILNSEATSLETQLAALSEAQRNFSPELLQGDPVSIVTPVETVPLLPAAALRARDAAVMGLFVGLVIGWITANMAESAKINVLMKKRREEEWDTGGAAPGVGSIFQND